MNPESREIMETALADAIDQRTKLDEWIAATQRLLGIEGDAALPSTAEFPGGMPGAISTLRPDSFFGMGIVPAAKKFLAMKKQPQTTTQIVEGLEAGGLQHTSKEFGNTVYAVLSREEKKTGEIVRVNQAWGLGEWYPGLRRKNLKTLLKGSSDAASDNPGTIDPA